MAILDSQWLRNIFSFRAEKLIEKCSESEECSQLLQLILDGEASPEQEKKFYQHIDTCVYCLNGYELEKSIRKLIKTKIKKQEVPTDLVDSIKLKIRQTV
jgi:anti-sigma factor (TIGR02949 family)